MSAGNFSLLPSSLDSKVLAHHHNLHHQTPKSEPRPDFRFPNNEVVTREKSHDLSTYVFIFAGWTIFSLQFL